MTTEKCEAATTQIPCVLCALKHIAKAKILGSECRLGYPEDYWTALAHLGLAEDHLILEHTSWANRIREERKKWENQPDYVVPFDNILTCLSCDTGYDIDAYIQHKGRERLYA